MMCLAIPGKVIEIKEKEVVVEFLGEKKKTKIINVKPKINDYVIVQAGVVIEVIDKEEAEKCLKAWKSLMSSEKT